MEATVINNPLVANFPEYDYLRDNCIAMAQLY